MPNILLKYSNEKLKELFNDEDVLTVTKFAIDRTKNNHHVGRLIAKNKPEYDREYGKYYNERLMMSIINTEYENNLKVLKDCEYDGIEKDIESLETGAKATNIIYNLLKYPKDVAPFFVYSNIICIFTP